MEEAKMDSTREPTTCNYSTIRTYLRNVPHERRGLDWLDEEPERAMHLKRWVLQEKAAEGCKWVKSTPVCLPN